MAAVEKRCSVTSNRSKGSVSSVSSKSSALSSIFGGMRSFGRRNTSSSVGAMVDLAVGDRCETISLVTVRRTEGLESAVVTELPSGVTLLVLEIGMGRRIKVRMGVATNGGDAVEGWISSKTKINEPLVTKVQEVEGFKVGSLYETKSDVVVRADELFDSEIEAELVSGTKIRILKFGTDNARRVKISSANVDGWISLMTTQGEVLLGAPDGSSEFDGHLIASHSTKVKKLLFAARAGDLKGTEQVLIQSKMSMFGQALSPNVADIRGKTALMYAAAFGRKDVVKFLVALPTCWIAAQDNTQKTALHHCAKRVWSGIEQATNSVQADMAGILINAGAYIESRDHNGCTALIFAVANGHEMLVERLLKARANVNVKDFEGNTPLDYAKNCCHPRTADILKRGGAVEEDEEEDTVGELPAATGLTGATGATDPKAGGVVKAEAAKSAGKPKNTAKGKAKAKAKGKSKAGKLGKGENIERIMTANIMEAMADPSEYSCDIIVEEAATEEEDAKTVAVRKVNELLKGIVTPQELEAALALAERKGATDKNLKAGHEELKKLKARRRAADELQEAIASLDVKALKAAIDKAAKNGVSPDVISNGENALKEETPKQEARDKLFAAKSSGSTTALQGAIADAKKARLASSELKEFEAILANSESKEKAEQALKQALDAGDLENLNICMQQAKDAGVGAALVSKAEEMIRVEGPKRKARQQLEEAIANCGKDSLTSAIKAAKAAGLAEAEVKEAEEALKREERKEELLEAVKKGLESSMSTDMTNVDSVRAAKEALASAIAEAINMGVPEADLHEAEVRRKKLHNTVEDLKGSIRVFCRIRPLSSKEKDQGDKGVTKQTDSMTLVVSGEQEHTFTFDAVFTPGTQEEIFEDCKDLVQSAVDGYNVTLFAYGQTGAGKTFTMAGVKGQLGVSPRTINEIYRVTKAGESRFHYTVMGSMLELYKQDLVDLLSKGDPTASKGKLNIRTDKTGAVGVEHLTEEECPTAVNLEGLLDRGMQNRATAATAMNSESSRSHLVLIIKIISVNHETKAQTKGKILIVDLAGSERLKKSQTTENAQKESIEINKSLTALGDTIEALTKGSKTIPYRNHKLTMLMQDALGGNAKTLMFVNCSPADSNTDETLISLKYAVRAKTITNKAKKS